MAGLSSIPAGAGDLETAVDDGLLRPTLEAVSWTPTTTREKERKKTRPATEHRQHRSPAGRLKPRSMVRTPQLCQSDFPVRCLMRIINRPI
jgi:hypothetical protein